MMLHDRRMLLGLLAAAVVSVAVLPFLLRADDPDRELHRRRIEGMTQAERERLQRNFRQFEAMDQTEQARMREFAAAIEADKQSNRGRVAETLRIYGEWLQTITPHQRDALQQETDPVKRLALIRKFVDLQRDDRIEVRMGGREEILGPIPNLTQEDLLAMLEVIDGKVGLLLPSRRELDEFEDPIRRSLKLFELLARADKNVRDLLNETNTRQLLAAVSNAEARRQLETLPETNRPIPESLARRMKLGLALFKAIEVELDREHRRKQISRENLNAFFERLPQDEQDELLTMAPGQFHQQLLSKYIETDWRKNRINMGLVRQFFRPQGMGMQRERLPQDPRRRDGRPFTPDPRDRNRDNP